MITNRNKTLEKQRQYLAEQNSAKDVLIIDLTKEVERLKGLLNIDGTNSGLPIGSTPINKKKVIQNSRENTGKKIGGQLGHAKKKLERSADCEVDTYVEHFLDGCQECQCQSGAGTETRPCKHTCYIP